MAYALVLVAALVFLYGMTQLKRVESAKTPWGLLLIWAVLFFGGASVWMLAAGTHWN